MVIPPGQTISRILFHSRVSKGRLDRRDHLSRLTVARQLMRSTRSIDQRAAECPCLTLLLPGVTWPPHYCGRRWSLTPPFHPYPLRGGMFLWPCPVNCFIPDVIRRDALWSADFPRHTCACRDPLSDLG